MQPDLNPITQKPLSRDLLVTETEEPEAKPRRRSRKELAAKERRFHLRRLQRIAAAKARPAEISPFAAGVRDTNGRTTMRGGGFTTPRGGLDPSCEYLTPMASLKGAKLVGRSKRITRRKSRVWESQIGEWAKIGLK